MSAVRLRDRQLAIPARGSRGAGGIRLPAPRACSTAECDCHDGQAGADRLGDHGGGVVGAEDGVGGRENAARACPGPAVRKSMKVSSALSGLGRHGRQRHRRCRSRERREVVASQRTPYVPWASRRKPGERQPVLFPIAEGAGVAADQHADAGRRRGRGPKRRAPRAGGRGSGNVDRRGRQADEVVGRRARLSSVTSTSPHVLGRQPAQPAAEDVGGAQHLGRSRIGGERLAARRHDDIGRRQRARADAVAEAQEARRGAPALTSCSSVRVGTRNRRCTSRRVVLDGAEPGECGDHPFGLVIVAGLAVGEQQGVEEGSARAREVVMCSEERSNDSMVHNVGYAAAGLVGPAGLEPATRRL